MSEITQYRLSQDGKELTVWLDKPVKVGNKITLKNGPIGWWKVEEEFQKSTLEFLARHRGWNNNI